MSNPGRPQAAAISADERFLAFARTGDRQILQGLVEESTDRAYNLARRILGRAQGADDVVQEAYLILVKTANRYDGKVAFLAWLSRIVTSTAIDHLRQAQRYSKISDSNQQGIAAVKNTATSDVPPDQPELEALRSALDELPELYRTPLTLHYFGGLNQSETAQAMGLSPGTIASQLSRGIEQLRSKLSRAGFAMTSAAIVTSLTGLPTYAAPPALSASVSLAASQGMTGATLTASGGIAAKPAAAVSFGAGMLKLAGAGILIITATLVVAQKSSFTHAFTGQDQAVSTLGGDSVPGLVAHWRFDEGQGASIHDATGTVQDGAVLGASWTAGKIGSALTFDGKSSRVELPTSPALNMRTALTVTAWVNPSRGDRYQRIFEHGATHELPFVEYSLNLSELNEARLELGFMIGLNNAHATGKTILPFNSWVHIAATWDGMTSRIYVNGNLDGSAATPGSISPYNDTSTIGYRNFTPDPDQIFNGAIDDLRVYDRALSEREIITVMLGIGAH